MTHNDVLRDITDIFTLDTVTIAEIFSLGNFKVTDEQIDSWLKTEEESAFVGLDDKPFACFLNGFIDFKRGQREGSQPKEAEEQLNNNIIFQKLRIALNLQTNDILEILERVNVHLSKHALSAFFRKPDNKHYRVCRDEVLQNFLLGLKNSQL